jgi:hypothetical protein
VLSESGTPRVTRLLPKYRRKKNLRVEHGETGSMNSIIYLIGLIVVVLAVLSFLGLR